MRKYFNIPNTIRSVRHSKAICFASMPLQYNEIKEFVFLKEIITEIPGGMRLLDEDVHCSCSQPNVAY